MILDTIVDWKKTEVARLKKHGIISPKAPVDSPRGFTAALLAFPHIAVIAEAKKASPSKGVICEDFDPVEIAASYKQGGAQAISVLTDEKFFQGRLQYLADVRAAIDLPVLRKDFIIDEIQIREAAIHGADAILLIAAILDTVQIHEYQAAAAALGLDVLVEIHDFSDLEKAMKAESRLIGINNRNLRDFSVDLHTTIDLRQHIPADIPVVSESGIKTHQDIALLQSAGITAVLIGETLMRAGRRDKALRQLMGWGQYSDQGDHFANEN